MVRWRALLFYGYATGVFSARKIERATYDALPFRFIAGGLHPDHDTIAHFRQTFRLLGTPMRVEFRTDDNPYAGRRNELTPRQVRSRKRLISRNKSGKPGGKR